MTLQEKKLREEIGAIADQMQAITQKATSADRGLTKQEKAKHSRLYHQAQAKQAELDLEVSNDPEYDGARPADEIFNPISPNASKKQVWQDKEGRDIEVYNSGQNMADGAPDVSLGEAAVAMLTGNGRPVVKNALSEGTDSAGGFTVPSATLTNFYDKMRAKNRVVQAGARTIKLTTDETTIARVSGDPTVQWHKENEQEADSDITFEGAVFKPKTLMILVVASRELIADSVNINRAMESVFAGSVAAAVDQGILFGSNTNGEMKGLTSYNIGQVDMGTDGAALTDYDPLVQAYRNMLDSNASSPTAYLMAPREWETLATLKDANNRYLDRPQALDGIPLYDTTHIPTDETHGTASNASRIVTGNWNELVIGLRQQMRIELLREKYADSYQFGFLVHMRVDALPAHDKSFAQITGIIP